MKKHDGFTLVELLAVIVILALLITISVPAVQRAMTGSRKLGINDFANKVFKKTEELIISSVNDELYSFAYVDETGLIVDIELLGLETYGDYKGKVFYDAATDELYIYIHDNKNMIVNYAYTDNDSTLKDIVKTYISSESASRFTADSICKDHTEDYICFEITSLYDTGTMPPMYVNTLPGASITPYVEGQVDLHQFIRQFVKEGSQEKELFSKNENSSDPIDNIYNVEVVRYEGQPAGSIQILPGLSQVPVYMSFDSSSGTLYFYSSTGMINLCRGCDNLFRYFTNLKSIDLTHFNFDLVTSTKGMFDHCINLESITVNDWAMRLNGDYSGMFRYCKKLKTVNVSSWSNIQMSYLDLIFEGCESLTSVDVSGWDISKVTSLKGIFLGCNNLLSIDVSNWDTRKVVNFELLFKNCKKLEYINVSKWNTGRARYMNMMFENDSALKEIDVSNWDTRNLESMYSMFKVCNKIQTLDLSKWNVSKIYNFRQAFHEMDYIDKIIFGNTENNIEISIEDEFWGDEHLTVIDLSHFNNLTFDSTKFTLVNHPTVYVSESYDGPMTVNNNVLTKF